MKKLVLGLVFAISMVASGSTSPKEQESSVEEAVLQLDRERTIDIHGAIQNLDKEYFKLANLANDSKDPIYIIIDSPGGSVIEGIKFIQLMDRVKSEGVEIICNVQTMAASMAFHIFSNCSSRYSFETSLLLWHPAYIYLRGYPLTEKEAERFKKQLYLLTNLLEKRARKALNLPEEVYNEYYYNEYFVMASNLVEMSPNFLKIIDNARFPD